MRRRGLLVVLVVVLAAAGCGRAPGPEGVATVNGEAIPRAAFEVRLESRLQLLRVGGASAPSADQLSQLRRQVLDELIGRQLLLQEAKRRGETVSADEVDAAVEAVRGEFLRNGARASSEAKESSSRLPEGQDAFQAALRERGITMAELRTDVESGLLARRVATSLGADVTADEAEARRYYEAHMPKFRQPPLYRLRLVATAREDEARWIVEQLRSGKTTFTREADRRATGILKETRGEMGWVDPSTLPPELARAAAVLEPGGIGGPVLTKGSFYLVQLVEKREATESNFEKVKADVQHLVLQEKRAAKVRAWIAQAREAAKILLAEDLR